MGEPRRALELMTAAAARTRLQDPVRAADILAAATGPAIMQGGIHVVHDLAGTGRVYLGALSDAEAAATPTALAMVADAFSISGDIKRAAVYLHRAAELSPSPTMSGELHGAAFHAQSLGWAERYSRPAIS